MTDYIKYAIAFVLFVVTGTMVMIPIFVSSMPSNNHVEEPESPRVIKVTHVPSKSESKTSSFDSNYEKFKAIVDESRKIADDTSLNDEEKRVALEKNMNDLTLQREEVYLSNGSVTSFNGIYRPTIGSYRSDFDDAYGDPVDSFGVSGNSGSFKYFNRINVLFIDGRAYSVTIPLSNEEYIKDMIPNDAKLANRGKYDSDKDKTIFYYDYTSNELRRNVPLSHGHLCIQREIYKEYRSLNNVSVSACFFDEPMFGN